MIARNGIVATSQPLAAQAGLEILKRGGNAADAAIATNAMMGLVEPMSCGIGGDLFCHLLGCQDAKALRTQRQRPQPLCPQSRRLLRKGLNEIPGEGSFCWSCPGCVDGWDQLLEAIRQKELAELFLPGHSNTPKRGFPSARSSPADGRRPMVARRR